MMNAIRAATADMVETLRGPTFWLIIAGVAAICFISGPFGTLDLLPWGIRLVYWTLQVSVPGIVGLWTHSLIRTQGWTGFPTLLLISVIFGFVIFALVVLFSLALLAPIGKYPGHLDLLLYSVPSAALIFMLLGIIDPRKVYSEAAEATGTNLRPKLLDRPKEHGDATQVWSLSAQDHYVEVVTDTGAELCLIRLADAIAEASPQDGIQIHRSHWVARAVIDALETGGKANHVRLKDGRMLAVSQARLAGLRRYLGS